MIMLKLAAMGAAVFGLIASMLAQPGEPRNFSLLQDAGKAIVAGDLAHAQTELQSILSTDPKEYRARNLLGVVRAQQKRESEAEQLFKQVIQEQPSFASGHINLGLLYAQTGNHEAAITELQQALKLAPTRTDARDALVGVLAMDAAAALQAQQSEKALALMIQARKASPRDPDVLFQFGMIALHMQLLPDAVQALQESLEIRQDDPKTMYGLGRAKMALGKFGDAEPLFQRYVSLRPDDASGHYALGLTLESLQRASEARKQFEESIRLQPEQTEAYFRLGLMDQEETSLDSATQRFHRVLQRDPKHAGALTGMGRIAFERKQYQDAVDLFQRAIESDKSLRPAHYYLGLAYGRLGKPKESQEQLQIATQLEREDLDSKRVLLKIMESADPAANSAWPPK